MDLWKLMQVVVRRWYISVPIVVLTAIAAVVAAARIDVGYTAETALALEPPGAADAGVGKPVSSPDLLATVLAEVVTASEPVTAPTATVSATGDGPFVRVTAIAPDAETARQAATEAMNTAVAEGQRRVPPAFAETALELVADPVVTATPAGFEAQGSVLVHDVFGGASPAPSRFDAQLLAYVAGADHVRQELGEEGATATYEVKVEQGGPLLRVTASDQDPDTVAATLDAVTARIEEEASSGTAGLSAPVAVRRLVDAPALRPEVEGKYRALVSIAVLGLILAFAAAVVVEGAGEAGTRRRSDTSRRSDPASDGERDRREPVAAATSTRHGR